MAIGLEPYALAGQNVGVLGPRPAEHARTAYDLKDVHRRLDRFGFTDDELKRLPILSPGTRLEQGATHMDLQAPDFHEFKALGNMEATRDHWFVPKDQVDYHLWNRLIGVQNPERLGQAPER